ncbi:hypothetical protein N0V86_008795 [Didymella sp. IMI 355093]|nr:hypothetical protein N0V86_008795 [Didymella sp. IMI 355093]
MRNRAWNMARHQYTATKRRVKKTMQKDWQRQERERLWDEAHAWYLLQYGHIPSDPETCSHCLVCARLKKQGQGYTKPAVSLTTTWWEHEGALAEEELVVPETPPRPLPGTPRVPQSQPRASQPSSLAGLIKTWRSMRAVSDEQRRIWEDRYKLDRAIRRKYDLPDDYDIEPELFANPLPASHARYHHRQLQYGEHAGERRTNRHKRRAEGYRPSRSSLALSELVNEVEMDEAEVERLRLEEQAAGLRRLADVMATEVGYLYFVGEMGLLERWRDEFEVSNLELIQRQTEDGLYVGWVGEEHVEAEGDMAF